jgi:hypothetical protein
MGKPRGQHPGLPGASAGKNEQRALDRLDGFALRRVQAAEVSRFGSPVRRHGRG